LTISASIGPLRLCAIAEFALVTPGGFVGTLSLHAAMANAVANAA
jgi:hypothetical protein